jgi:phage I-like protein
MRRARRIRVLESDADNVIAEFATRGRDLVIDFEHQTLSGGKAPAAGWIDRMERTAEGLVAKVKYWTEAACGHLQSGEYRYFSPVFHFSRSGRSVSAIHSVALTNHPAMHAIPALVADDSAADEAPQGREVPKDTTNNGVKMNELLKSLGLLALADADEEERMKAIIAQVDSLLNAKSSVEGFLKLHDFASLDEATERLKGMIPASEKADLEKALRSRDAEALVAKAFADGKLAGKSRAWAVSFAERDPDAFKEWAEAAPRIIPDNMDVDGAASGTPQGAVSETELKVFKTLGLSDRQIEKLIKGV